MIFFFIFPVYLAVSSTRTLHSEKRNHNKQPQPLRPRIRTLQKVFNKLDDETFIGSGVTGRRWVFIRVRVGIRDSNVASYMGLRRYAICVVRNIPCVLIRSQNQIMLLQRNDMFTEYKSRMSCAKLQNNIFGLTLKLHAKTCRSH